MKTTSPLLLIFLAACGPEAIAPASTDQTSTTAVTQNPAVPPATDPPQPAPTGFPCAVRLVLQTNCASCHLGQMYIEGFSSRTDFLAPMGDGTTFGQLMVSRITSEAKPMPPYGADRRPTADERATLSAWVESGMPAGDCGDLTRP